MGHLEVVSGHSRSLAIASFHTVCVSSYYLVLFLRDSVILVENRLF